MKVLLTGVTGFLGQYVAKRLLSEGHTVIGVSRHRKEIDIINDIEFHNLDLIDIRQLLKCSKGVDCIIHTAALSTVWGKEEDFMLNNVIATKNIIQACKHNKIPRCIHISSPSVYTNSKDSFCIKEEDCPSVNDFTYYIKTKLLAEQEIIKSTFSSDTKFIILRPRGIFGIGDTSIIPRLINVNKKIGIPYINKGKSIIDITHVTNVVEAVMLSLKYDLGDNKYEIFNITNDQSVNVDYLLNLLFGLIDEKPRYIHVNFKFMYTVAYILESVHKLLNIYKEPILTRYTVCTIGNSQTLDITKAKNKLHYKPIITLEKGIEEYAKWYKQFNRNS